MRWVPIAAVAATLATVAGCETQERVVPGSSTTVRHRFDDTERESREDVLLERAEDDPENPKVWFDLGSYYEDGQQFVAAIQSYEQLYGLSEREAAKQGVYFTAGAYHLGRAHARARNYREAVRYLNEVVEHQPRDPKTGNVDVVQASLNSHFREAHYLLGAIFYDNRQWKPAREHFVTFRELGGEPVRVEPWLARIDEAEWSGTIRTRPAERVEGTPPPAAPAPTSPAAPRGD